MHYVTGSAPHKVFTLLVEMRCNSYCLFCGQREVDEALIRTRRRLALAVPRNEFAGVHARYTLETATETLSRARSEGFTQLSFQGGEPTIWPDLPALVGRARAMGFDFVGMVTNGRRLADRAYAGALLEAGLHGMTISLLGPDASTHDALSAAPGSFDALTEGMRNVSEIVRERSSSVYVGANLIVTRKNVDVLDRCIEVLASYGVRSATLLVVRFEHMGSDPAVRDLLRIDGSKLRDALKRTLAAARAHGVQVQSTDLPECMHETLDPERLARRAHAERESRHRHEAADFGFDYTPTRSVEASCTGCLLESGCARIPVGHGVSPSPFVPIDAASLGAALDARLASMDPRASDAVAQLVAERASYAWLERLAGREGALAALRDRVTTAIADVMEQAYLDRDPEQLLAAASALTGFTCPAKTFGDGRDDWPSSIRRVALLERNAARLAHADAVLAVGPVDVLLAGVWDGDALVVSSVQGVRLESAERTTSARRHARLQLVAVAQLSSLFERAKLTVASSTLRIERPRAPAAVCAFETDVVRWRARRG
jgi:MoaA/NifB/PqqE/SkfB family radical SAM enzyme